MYWFGLTIQPLFCDSVRTIIYLMTYKALPETPDNKKPAISSGFRTASDYRGLSTGASADFQLFRQPSGSSGKFDQAKSLLPQKLPPNFAAIDLCRCGYSARPSLCEGLFLTCVEHPASLLRSFPAVEKDDLPTGVDFYDYPPSTLVWPHLVLFHADVIA